MKILIYLGHPAHFHLFKNIIRELKNNSQNVIIVTKRKDVLEDLLRSQSWKYLNIYPKERKGTKTAIAYSLFIKDLSLLKITIKTKPNLMIGTSSEITHVGQLLGIKSLVVNEDDIGQVPFFAKLSYPFANSIIVPSECSVGKWENKTTFYDGYHELAYLHPKNFIPKKEVINSFNPDGKKYFILRFAKLTAHHDKGKTGITTEIAQNIIDKLLPHGEVYITSERELEPRFEKYKIKINPLDIHHALYFADLYIGDSQTMAAEAAVLGTPSLRFNDFVGKLGYLEELEHKYGLTYGIKTEEPEKLFNKINELLNTKDLKEEWQKRRGKMLSEKIDVTAFMVWFIENYPNSVKIMKDNPDYQYNFR